MQFNKKKIQINQYSINRKILYFVTALLRLSTIKFYKLTVCSLVHTLFFSRVELQRQRQRAPQEVFLYNVMYISRLLTYLVSILFCAVLNRRNSGALCTRCAHIAAILIPQLVWGLALFSLAASPPSYAPWQIAFNFSALFTQGTPELIARYPPSGLYLIAGHLNSPSKAAPVGGHTSRSLAVQQPLQRLHRGAMSDLNRWL